VITDLFQSRLDFAKKLVPGVKPLLIERGWSPKEAGAKIKETAEVPLKLALECTGVQSSIHSAIYVGRHPSVALNVNSDHDVPVVDAIWRESLHHWCRQK
jgi:hypothetical protein